MRASLFASLLIAAAIPVGACGAPGPSPTTTPAVTAPVPLFPTTTKYALLDRFRDIFFCDPDFYPVGRPGQEEQRAEDLFPTLRQNVEEFQAITARLGLQGGADFSSKQKLQVYREHKRLNAIQLEQLAAGYRFVLRTGENQGSSIQGTVSSQGTITVTKQEPVFNTCPICLSGDSLVATPAGDIPVKALAVGMTVWTLDSNGQRLSALVLQTVRRDLPPGSLGLHLRLDDGRELRASAAHPTADGRLLGSYQVGELLDGARVGAIDLLSFPENATFDLLPAGPTAIYWVNGIALKSTLTP